MTEHAGNQTEATASSASGRWTLARIGSLSVLAAYMCFLVVQWRYESTRWSTGERSCMHNLKWLGLALYNYHEDHGTFPPAYLADAEGKPMHSWRVLLLPYLEQQKLYDQYDFSEPWNGPNNKKLLDHMPALYGIGESPFHCPRSQADADTKLTSYVAVMGGTTAWPGEKPLATSEVSDGLGQTIQLVEIRDSDILWTEPRDLSLDGISIDLSQPGSSSIGSPHITSPEWFWQARVPFVNVLTTDWAVSRLPPSTDAETMKALLTVNGGENVDITRIRLPWGFYEWRTFRLAGLPTFLFMLIALAIGVFTKRMWFAVCGSLGSLLGVVMPEPGIHPNCSTAEAYARLFENWTSEHVAQWGVTGLLLGLIFAVIIHFTKSRPGREMLSH